MRSIETGRAPRRGAAGWRRRGALFFVILVGASTAGMAVAAARATHFVPPPVPQPTEADRQLTIAVDANGVISLPFRSHVLCGGPANCPRHAPVYTTVLPGSLTVVVTDASGTKMHVSMPGFARVLDAGHMLVTKTLTLRSAHQYVFTARVGNTMNRIVVWATPVPYSTTTMTTLPSTTHVEIFLDEQGVHVPAGPFPPGQFSITFDDRRANPVGAAAISIQVQPHLGTVVTIPADTSADAFLCPHNWFVETVVNGSDILGGSLDVEGSNPACTTPIT